MVVTSQHESPPSVLGLVGGELARERAVEARKEEDDHRSDNEGVAARRVNGALRVGASQ